MKNIAVFAAGRGSNFEQLCRAEENKKLAAHIVLLIASKPDIGAIEIAKRYNIPAVVFKRKSYPDAESYTEALLQTLKEYKADYVALAGWLQLIHPSLIRQFPDKIVNIHPALLPFFGGPGMYGKHVHQAVWESGMRVSGATVHIVDEEYDKGPILAQRAVQLDYGDGPEEIAGKVLQVEHALYPETLQLLVNGVIAVENNKVVKQK